MKVRCWVGDAETEDAGIFNADGDAAVDQDIRKEKKRQARQRSNSCVKVNKMQGSFLFYCQNIRMYEQKTPGSFKCGNLKAEVVLELLSFTLNKCV